MVDAEHCKSCSLCGAAIAWATTTTGASMPVDFEPSEGANLVLFDGPKGLLAVAVHGSALAHKPRHRAHDATCPLVDKQRRKRAHEVEARCARRATP